MRRPSCVFASALLVAFATLPARAQTQANAITLELPCAMAYDAQGNLVFAERGGHVVRRLSSEGVITTIAGTGVQGFSGDGGPAISAELNSPCGLAVDSAGNIYIADTSNHRVREVAAATGIISTVGGTGQPGFSGDGGPATSARLDAPSALALDSSGDLYTADTRNHRIRRIAASDQIIETVAGSGTQGLSGDGGPAISAALDSPSGVALDPTGNLLIADTRNQRIREVSASTGIIRTIAGSGPTGPGLPSFTGDGGAASSATLALPHGLSVDSSGNIYIADTVNQRIRRVDGVTGAITTVAGAGVQGFTGDGDSAATASLDSPRSVAVNGPGLVTLADTGNARIRQVDPPTSPAPEIRTIAGLGAELSIGGLLLSGPSVVPYGSGAVTAVVSGGSSATGSVTFLDTSSASPMTLGTVPLTTGTAILSTAALAAGAHTLTASYAGDTSHAAAQSQALRLTVTPLPLTATAQPVTILYGQLVPSITGNLAGVLPQDASGISATFATSATTLSAAGTYPITAALSGPAAGNYTVSSISGAVTIAKAPTSTSLTASGAGTLSVEAASSTSGIPTGTIILLDQGVTVTMLPLTGGSDTYTAAALTTGTHSIVAYYGGDANFLASSSDAVSLGSGGGNSAPGDFTFALTGASSQAVPSGSTAVYTLTITPQSGGLSSPVDLTVSGLPAGMTASFNPAYLPPTGVVTSVILTVQTTKTAFLVSPIRPSNSSGIKTAGLLGPFLGIVFFRSRRRHSRWNTTFPLLEVIAASAACIVFATLASGCGNRVNVGSEVQSAPTYTLTVTGTATSASGTPIQHFVSVTLQVL